MTKLEKVLKGLECCRKSTSMSECEMTDCPYYTFYDHLRYLFNDVLELLKAQQWISVKDRLPSEEDYKECKPFPDGAVLWYDGTSVGVGWYYESTNKWSDIDDHEVVGVTLWKPIFEPPKEGNSE